jgi:transposase-like protein
MSATDNHAAVTNTLLAVEEGEQIPRDQRYRCPECGLDLVDDEHGVSR